MELYLFPALTRDETIQNLLRLREGAVALGDLYPALFDFACRWAYTGHTVREYVVRAMLRTPPALWRAELMAPYLQRDAGTVYELFFQTDWDRRCADALLLPLPGAGSPNPPGEADYRSIITRLVAADSPAALCEGMADFFARYRDEQEAMYRAFHWDGELVGVRQPDPIAFDDLWGLEHQKQVIEDNTRAFVEGRPANDVLLIGGSGTGKSSCVKAVLGRFADQGLGLAEIPNNSLAGLSALMERLAEGRRKYIVFIDDLSFETADKHYLALKTTLDGQVAGRPDNVLIYATSNRRHLVRESWKDRDEDEDIHENDTIHEKLSLSERFGVRLYFPLLSQQEYLGVVGKLLRDAGAAYNAETGKAAVAWASMHNGRSGRTARQFVRNHLATQG